MKSSKGEIVEAFKAFSVKWKCEKGHSNFITILEGTKEIHDTCLKCGKHYKVSL